MVSGTAVVHRDDTEYMLRENESTFIAAGAVHRLYNPGQVDLHMIEVQSGEYVGEDDIVRIADDYGREGAETPKRPLAKPAAKSPSAKKPKVASSLRSPALAAHASPKEKRKGRRKAKLTATAGRRATRRLVRPTAVALKPASKKPAPKPPSKPPRKPRKK